MARLSWDNPNERPYYSGVDQGVFYPINGSGVVWNGLISVDERYEYSDFSAHSDSVKANLSFKPDLFSGTLRAYTYPTAFESYSGFDGLVFDNQKSRRFNLTYRTFRNDSEELIHLVYNAIAKPSDLSYSSQSEEVSLSEFSWDISTTPSRNTRSAPSSHFIVNVMEMQTHVRHLLYDILYGTPESEPRMPDIQELIETLEEQILLRIIDHGDGTWTAIGPDTAIEMLDDVTFAIDWPSAIFITDDKYSIEDY